MSRERLPPFDLLALEAADLRHDASAGIVVALLALPQCVAYALVAGLPPVMGLYSAAIPAIVGSLLRSSRHVITGPSNAVSLLTASVIARQSGVDPLLVVCTLSTLCGIVQVVGGLLRLGVIADYISGPVVLGYTTGAAALIAIGQLDQALGIEGADGPLPAQLTALATSEAPISLPTLGLTVGTIASVLLLQRLDRRIPAALVVMVLGIIGSYLVAYDNLGIQVLGDLSPIPPGLPPLTLPSLELAGHLIPGALACVVLSFVESAAVARSLAQQSGQRLQPSTELFGQGMANVAAGLFGGFPTSASLTRSALNLRSGARTRLAGVISGVAVLIMLGFAGPLLDQTPVPILAGLLLVLAAELINPDRVFALLRTGGSDATAFVVTVLGTWLLPLDRAIELGVVVSVVFFLRRARLLVITELRLEAGSGILREGALEDEALPRCERIRILHLEGPLFFAAAYELQRVLDDILADPRLRVVILRLKRAQGLDSTVAQVIADAAKRLEERDGGMILVGLRDDGLARARKTGLLHALGERNVIPTEGRWFAAMRSALLRAQEYVGPCKPPCPMADTAFKNVAH